MNLDPSVVSDEVRWSNAFIGDSRISNLSNITLEFEEFITTLRSATAHLRRGTTESEELMSEWLRIRFMEKRMAAFLPGAVDVAKNLVPANLPCLPAMTPSPAMFQTVVLADVADQIFCEIVAVSTKI